MNSKKQDERIVQSIISDDEINAIIRYHESAAKYQADNERMQLRIANTEPLYIFGSHQTKEDWLRTAEEWGRSSHRHTARADFWRMLWKDKMG